MKNIFIIRYVWLWSNPEGKYFYPAFLEQHLDTSDYLLSLEIQLILNHLGFLFLFQWKDWSSQPNLSFRPAPEHSCEADGSQVSLCGQAKQTGGISKFHVNILCRSSKAGSFFSPSLWHQKWIASAAGILGDRQRLGAQKKATILLRFAVFWLTYFYLFLLYFFFLSL